MDITIRLMLVLDLCHQQLLLPTDLEEVVSSLHHHQHQHLVVLDMEDLVFLVEEDHLALALMEEEAHLDLAFPEEEVPLAHPVLVVEDQRQLQHRSKRSQFRNLI